MSAERCPVCNGSGKVHGLAPIGTMPTEVCHGCGGRGWVETHKPEPFVFYPPLIHNSVSEGK